MKLENTPMGKKMYPPEELARIENKKNHNDEMEKYYADKVTEWNDKLNPVYQSLGKENLNPNNYKNIIEAQSTALELIQEVNYEISYYSQRLTKIISKLMELQQHKQVFYSTNFGLKTNQREMITLIEGNLREDIREEELFKIHLGFLTNTSKAIQNFLYSVKNLADLYNYLGK